MTVFACAKHIDASGRNKRSRNPSHAIRDDRNSGPLDWRIPFHNLVVLPTNSSKIDVHFRGCEGGRVQDEAADDDATQVERTGGDYICRQQYVYEVLEVRGIRGRVSIGIDGWTFLQESNDGRGIERNEDGEQQRCGDEDERF